MATSTIPYTGADSGTMTTVNGSISGAERARWNRSGRAVVIGLTFTTNASISGSTDVLFSGAPKAQTPVRTFLHQMNAQTGGVFIRVEINGNGEVTNAYTSGGIPAGQYEGEIMYISQ